MKRSEMPARTVPLDRGAPLHRAPIAAISTTGKPRKPLTSRIEPAVPTAVKRIIVFRSGKACEIMRVGCAFTATDPAHRMGRGVGGPDVPANVLYVCRACHSWCHAHPALSYGGPRYPNGPGLMLRRGTDPYTTPVLYRGHLVLLDDIGGITPYIPEKGTMLSGLPVLPLLLREDCRNCTPTCTCDTQKTGHRLVTAGGQRMRQDCRGCPCRIFVRKDPPQ